MKNKIITLALILFLPFVITACTIQDLPVIGGLFKSGGSKEPVTLLMWGMWESSDTMTMLINKYTEQHPNVTIKYEDRSVLGADDYKDRVFLRANEDIGADIILVHNSWVPRLRSVLTPAPGNLVTAETYKSRFYPVTADSALDSGSNKVYAIPAYYDGLVLVYNKTHFAEIGQSEPPTAWEEFRRVALQLTIISGTGSGSLVRGGAAIGAADNVEFFSDILGLMFAQADVKIPDDIDNQSGQDALNFYAHFVTEDRVWDTGLWNSVEAFINEKVSMIFLPSWRLLDVVAARPDLDIGVAAVPQVSPEKQITWGSFWMYAVPASSKNSAAAWDFINFLGADEQQQALFDEGAKYRLYGVPYSSTALSGQLSTNPFLDPLLTSAPFARSAEITDRSGNKRQVEALREAVNAVLNGGDAGDALKKAKEKLK